jgi:integrase
MRTWLRKLRPGELPGDDPGRDGLAPAPGDRWPTCDEYVERYLREYGNRCRVSSLHTQAQRLRRFREDFRGESLNMTRVELKRWVYGEGRFSDRGPVPESQLPAVISLFNHAIDEGELPLERNPARGLTPRYRGRRSEPPPTAAEFEALVQACSTLGAYGKTMRSLLLFAAYTLMRPSELFALEWRDIDFPGMRIRKLRRAYRGTLDEPKTGIRTIALMPPARDAIWGLPRDSELVFTSPKGRPLTTTSLWEPWNRVRTAAGLDFHFYHATKHFGVHYMWTELGLSPRAIAAQAGWSLETANRMLAIYGHGEVGALEEIDEACQEEIEFPGADVAERLRNWVPRANKGGPPRRSEPARPSPPSL